MKIICKVLDLRTVVVKYCVCRNVFWDSGSAAQVTPSVVTVMMVTVMMVTVMNAQNFILALCYSLSWKWQQCWIALMYKLKKKNYEHNTIFVRLIQLFVKHNHLSYNFMLQIIMFCDNLFSYFARQMCHKHNLVHV